MDIEEHKEIHEKLHLALDELLADYIEHNPEKLPTKSTIMELVIWSHQQVIKPEV